MTCNGSGFINSLECRHGGLAEEVRQAAELRSSLVNESSQSGEAHLHSAAHTAGPSHHFM